MQAYKDNSTIPGRKSSLTHALPHYLVGQPTYTDQAAALAAQFGVTLPIKNQPREFLSLLWAPLPNGENISFVAKKDKSETRHFPKGNPSALTAALAWAATRNREGASIYYNVASRKPGLSQWQRGGKDDLLQVTALWADFDCQSKGVLLSDSMVAILAMPIKPTVVNFSGGGLQPVWMLREPFDVSTAAGVDAFDALIKSFFAPVQHRAEVDGDVFEAVRMMRLPGFINQKPERAGAVARIVYFDPAALYTWADIQAITPELPAAPKPPAPRPELHKLISMAAGKDSIARYVQKSVDKEIAILAGWPAGQKRNKRTNKTAYALGRFVGAGVFDEGEARRLLISAAQQCGTWQKRGEAQTLATIESGLRAGKLKPATAHLASGQQQNPPLAENPKPAPASPDGLQSPLTTTVDAQPRQAIYFTGGLPEGLYHLLINVHKIGDLQDHTPAAITYHLGCILADRGLIDPRDFTERELVDGAATIGWNTTRGTISKGLAQMASLGLLRKTEAIRDLSIGEQDSSLSFRKSQKSARCQIRPPHRPGATYRFRKLKAGLYSLVSHLRNLIRMWFFQNAPDEATSVWFNGKPGLADLVNERPLTDEQVQRREKAKANYDREIAERETALNLAALLNAPRVPVLPDREYKNAIDYRDNYRLAQVRANPDRAIKFKDALKETGRASGASLAASNRRTGIMRVAQYKEMPITATNARATIDAQAGWALGLKRHKDQTPVAMLISKGANGENGEIDINKVYGNPERWIEQEAKAGRTEIVLKVQTVSTERPATPEEWQAMQEAVQAKRPQADESRRASNPLVMPSLTVWPHFAPSYVEKQLAMRRLRLIDGNLYDLETGENLTAGPLQVEKSEGDVYTPVTEVIEREIEADPVVDASSAQPEDDKADAEFVRNFVPVWNQPTQHCTAVSEDVKADLIQMQVDRQYHGVLSHNMSIYQPLTDRQDVRELVTA